VVYGGSSRSKGSCARVKPKARFAPAARGNVLICSQQAATGIRGEWIGTLPRTQVPPDGRQNPSAVRRCASGVSEQKSVTGEGENIYRRSHQQSAWRLPI